MHDAVKDVMQANQMMDNTLTVVNQAREKGCKVVHAPITFSDDYRELRDQPFGILAAVKDGGCFKASEWGTNVNMCLHSN